MINAAAPAAGALITLTSSNNAAAGVPASVVIPNGATSAGKVMRSGIVIVLMLCGCAGRGIVIVFDYRFRP